jgi:hypothetical protein
MKLGSVSFHDKNIVAQFDMHVLEFVTRLKQTLASLPFATLLLKKDALVSLMVFVAFWGVFLTYTGTLTSGYHLIDDWTMVHTAQNLSRSNPISVAAGCIQDDFRLRFRPTYCVHGVFSLWLLGLNFIGLSTLLMGLAILSSWLLYLFARKIGSGKIHSFLFVFLTFLGMQTAIWWRLGPQESIGMSWLALGLVFMANAIYDVSNRRKLYTLIALVSFVITSLAKESFIVLLPVLALWWLMLYWHRHKTTLVGAMRSHMVQILVLMIVCVAELAIVFSKVGINNIGYVVDAQSLTIRSIAGTLKVLLASNNAFLTLFLGAVLTSLLIASILTSKGTIKEKFKKHLSLIAELSAVAVFVLLFTMSQAVLYAKSGIFERYLLPGALGLAFVVIYLIIKIQQLVKRQGLNFVVTTLLIVVTLISLRTQYTKAFTAAKEFTQDGTSLHQALDKLGAATQDTDVIVIVSDPAWDDEATFSTRTYLEFLFKRKNLFVYPLWSRPQASYSESFSELGNLFVSRLGNAHIDNLEDKSRIKAILTYSGMHTDDALRENPPGWFDRTKFVRNQFGTFVVYTSRAPRQS